MNKKRQSRSRGEVKTCTEKSILLLNCALDLPVCVIIDTQKVTLDIACIQRPNCQKRESSEKCSTANRAWYVCKALFASIESTVRISRI